jgi:hypothetical protein
MKGIDRSGQTLKLLPVLPASSKLTGIDDRIRHWPPVNASTISPTHFQGERGVGLTTRSKARLLALLLGALGLIWAPNASAATHPTSPVAESCVIRAVVLHADSVTFVEPAGCLNTLSLVSYSAPGAHFDPRTAGRQKVAGSHVGARVAPGRYTWSVALPPCYYQLDFVYGRPLAKLGPPGSSNFYGNRVIAQLTGGHRCAPAQPKPTAIPKPTTKPKPTVSVTPPQASATPGPTASAAMLPPDSIVYPTPSVPASVAAPSQSTSPTSKSSRRDTGMTIAWVVLALVALAIPVYWQRRPRQRRPE